MMFLLSYALLTCGIFWLARKIPADPPTPPAAIAPGPPLVSHGPLSPLPPFSPAPSSPFVWTTVNRNGEHYWWHWRRGDWDAFLPALAATVAAHKITMWDASCLIGDIAYVEKIPDPQMFDLAERLGAMVAKRELAKGGRR